MDDDDSRGDRRVVLETGDNRQLPVRGSIASRCDYIKYMMDFPEFEGEPIAVPGIEFEELVKVMNYCMFQQKAEVSQWSEQAIHHWERKFASMNGALALKVLHAAEYLVNKHLTKLLNKTIQEATIGKSDDEIYIYVTRGISLEHESGASGSFE